MKGSGARRAWICRGSWIRLAVLATSLITAASAGEIQWDLLRPSNSGIPGEEVRIVRWGPDGNPWVVARWPFWSEGGIGIFDRAADVWSVWANWETPIPSEYINDLKFDEDGAAWIATDRGLVRWDGQEWTIYDPTNTPMTLYKVTDISIAPNGHIWINNSDFNLGGDAIYDFDGVGTWRKFSVPDDLPWEAPWTDLADVFVDHNGTVWVSNRTLNGLAEYDGVNWTLHGETVTLFESIVEDNVGNLWMIGNPVAGDEAYFKFDGSTFTRFGFASPTIITTDPEDGAIYAANWFGTILRSTNNGVSWPTWLSGLNRVHNIAPEPGSSDVWIGTSGAVGHFTFDGTLLRDYNSNNTGMPWYWVDYMMTDRSGDFWVATGEMGLSQFDGLRWRNWGAHNAGSEPYPFGGNEPMGGAYEDVNGVHWFGGNGIARWDEETGLFTGFWNWENNPGMGVSLWIFFAEDASGNLFSAEKYGGIYRFDPEVSLWIKEPIQPYAVAGLPGMQADGQGNVWVAAWFDIHKWDGVSWSTVTLPDPNYFFDLGGINAMAIGPDDVFWFGTIEGLVRWDGETFTLYDSGNSPLPANGVRGVAVRDDGLVGLSAHDNSAASSGIAVIDGDVNDPASWSVFEYGQSPQPHWQIQRAAFDPEGNLWVSALSMGVAILLTGDTAAGVEEAAPGLDGISLLAAPNPLRHSTSLVFELPTGGRDVSLGIYDSAGRLIRRLVEGFRGEGRHTVVWEGSDESGRSVARGVYFARINVGGQTPGKKLILLK